MMTTLELNLAILLLLVTPGPTNTLMFLAGAERGFARAARLIPAELAGYLATVIPLTLIGAPVFGALPKAQAVVAILAGLWVALLALRLWRLPPLGSGLALVAWRSVALTTLLNPKALIFGLVLLPDQTHALQNLGNFAVQVVLVALLWIALGDTVGKNRGAPSPVMPLVRRVASVWLAMLSVMLILRGAGLA